MVEEEKEYAEYFMPVADERDTIRWENTEKKIQQNACRKQKIDVNHEKTKSQKSHNLCKLFCWLLILLVLAGGITVAVLIGSKQLNKF